MTEKCKPLRFLPSAFSHTLNSFLIPGSLKARAYLKRIFMGKLVPLPSEVYEDMASYEPPVENPPDKVCRDFKIIYAIGKK